jgi:hypothetical protein
MFQPDNLNKRYQANLQAVTEWTAGLLDAAESAWKLQMDAADELSHAAFAQWRASGGELDFSNPLAAAPTALSRSVERSTVAMRAYMDTAVKLQTGLAEIVQSRMPQLTRGLSGMWLAPWGEFAAPAAETARRSAAHDETRVKKAA